MDLYDWDSREECCSLGFDDALLSTLRLTVDPASDAFHKTDDERYAVPPESENLCGEPYSRNNFEPSLEMVVARDIGSFIRQCDPIIKAYAGQIDFRLLGAWFFFERNHCANGFMSWPENMHQTEIEALTKIAHSFPIMNQFAVRHQIIPLSNKDFGVSAMVEDYIEQGAFTMLHTQVEKCEFLESIVVINKGTDEEEAVQLGRFIIDNSDAIIEEYIDVPRFFDGLKNDCHFEGGGGAEPRWTLDRLTINNMTY